MDGPGTCTLSPLLDAAASRPLAHMFSYFLRASQAEIFTLFDTDRGLADIAIEPVSPAMLYTISRFGKAFRRIDAPPDIYSVAMHLLLRLRASVYYPSIGDYGWQDDGLLPQTWVAVVIMVAQKYLDDKADCLDDWAYVLKIPKKFLRMAEARLLARIRWNVRVEVDEAGFMREMLDDWCVRLMTLWHTEEPMTYVTKRSRSLDGMKEKEPQPEKKPEPHSTITSCELEELIAKMRAIYLASPPAQPSYAPLPSPTPVLGTAPHFHASSSSTQAGSSHRPERFTYSFLKARPHKQETETKPQSLISKLEAELQSSKRKPEAKSQSSSSKCKPEAESQSLSSDYKLKDESSPQMTSPRFTGQFHNDTNPFFSADAIIAGSLRRIPPRDLSCSLALLRIGSTTNDSGDGKGWKLDRNRAVSVDSIFKRRPTGDEEKKEEEKGRGKGERKMDNGKGKVDDGRRKMNKG